MSDHWVFAYGSLMWNPGFPVAEAVRAHAHDFARSFCMRSVVHRGTTETPGLVLGLELQPGACCHGLALRVHARDWPATLTLLRRRELPTDAYAEVQLPIFLEDGRQVEGLTYVIRRDHRQYWTDLDTADQARIIAEARGKSGANAEYLFNTARHLEEMNIDEPQIHDLARRVAQLMKRNGGDHCC